MEEFSGQYVTPNIVECEDGFYRWDVPQGEWQVKYEKDGYETCYSEWLPVPPPQLDVNVGMRQTTSPKFARYRLIATIPQKAVAPITTF